MNVIIDDLSQRQAEFKREFHFDAWSSVYRMTGYRLRWALKLLKRIRYTDRGVVGVDGYFIKDGDALTTKQLLTSRACLRAYLDGVAEARQNPALPLAAAGLSDYGQMINQTVLPIFDQTVKVLQDLMAFLDRGVKVRYNDNGNVNDVIEFPGATVSECVRLYTLVSWLVAQEDSAIDAYSHGSGTDSRGAAEPRRI